MKRENKNLFAIMKKTALILMSTIGVFTASYSQSQPYLLIDNVNTQFTTVSLPYWLRAGQTVNLSTNSKSASVLEFNVNGTNLEFSQAISLTSLQTVPTNKVWKIEGIGLRESSTSLVNLSNSGSSASSGSSTNLPTIYQSPKKYDTPGTYNWQVPPGITSICVEVWGGGGNGGTNPLANGRIGGCGGGGGYGYQCFTVVPATTYLVTVGGNGGSSSLGSLITANSGQNGANSIGTAHGIGGTGGTSSANFSISGTSGDTWSNFISIAKGGNGGNGGNGGSTIGNNGGNGVSPGGGGGGSSGGTYTPGAGGNGQIIIYW